MPDPLKETDWLAKVPLWFKAGMGFLGTIATIVGFIVAWRENAPLFSLVALAMLLGGLFLVSLYIFIARRKTRSKTIPGAYRYPRWRLLGLLGMLAVCLVLAAPYFIKPLGERARDALRGSPTPTASFTPSPTLTLIPSPTPVPTFTPIPPARVEDPDVWIAPFKVSGSVPNQWAEGEIEEALRDQLEQFEGQKVTVRVDGPPIQEFSQAQDILNNGRTKVVIWGEYNEVGAQVWMHLSDEAGAGTPLAVTGVIDILPESHDSRYSLSFTLKQKVPENISFLSLFVIGHLAYLSRDYRTGQEAFDAAMRKMPKAEDVVIQNEAILSFFRARDLHKREVPDLAGAICEYVEAIQADRQSGVVSISDVAYNNLGLVISRFYGITSSIPDTPETPIPPEAATCLQALGLLENEYQDPKVLFQRALEINPNLTLARYNRIVFEWLQNEERGLTENKAQFYSRLDGIEAEDASIVGTYILRGVVHDETGEDAEALQMYLRGIQQNPRIPLMHMNAGQLYISQENNLPEAEKHLRAALYLEPDHQEARLALGNLYYRSDRLPEASQQLDVIDASAGAAPSASVPMFQILILRSGIAFKQADVPAASEYLNQAAQLNPSDPFVHVLIGLLHQSEGRMDEALLSFETARGLNSSAPQGVWTTFKGLCFSDGQLPTPFADWMRDQLPSSLCLGRDLNDANERLRAFYDLFSDALLQRRDPAVFYLLGAQCPYVYTQDPITGEWEFQTTILYQVVNQEGAQIRPLSQFTGRLLIREAEPEVSHLNRLYVLAEMEDGSFQTLDPDVTALRHIDGEYVVLHQGDEILVALDDYPMRGDVRQWWVMVVGYYTPLP